MQYFAPGYYNHQTSNERIVMKLIVHSIENNGVLQSERVLIQVKGSVNIGKYIISDTTYIDDKTVSNELRHIYWFPDKDVSAGDWIIIYTKDGTPRSYINNNDTTIHELYWNLGKTVWNKDGDCAILFEIIEWMFKKG